MVVKIKENRIMRKNLICSFLLLVSLFAQAQSTATKMRFNKQGEFKIAQFTDMHLGDDTSKNERVFAMLQGVLHSEHPDLVIFTGDNTTRDAVKQTWNHLANILAKAHTPWTAVLGNHDDEHAVKRAEIIKIIAQMPYCIMANVAEGIKGEGNHIVPIYGHDEAQESPLALLYCLDSNSYSTLSQVKGYGWFDLSQINWYQKQSRKYTQENGGKPLPALAFFHIPLPEYVAAWNATQTRRFGDRGEKECCPKINSGLFTAMLNSGDVMGTFVGHDHINDYIATWYNIALAYGRASGGKNTYGEKTPGSRIIVLKEGKRAFETWIREEKNNELLQWTAYPTSFQLESSH